MKQRGHGEPYYYRCLLSTQHKNKVKLLWNDIFVIKYIVFAVHAYSPVLAAPPAVVVVLLSLLLLRSLHSQINETLPSWMLRRILTVHVDTSKCKRVSYSRVETTQSALVLLLL